jgi:hypothetical protein
MVDNFAAFVVKSLRVEDTLFFIEDLEDPKSASLNSYDTVYGVFCGVRLNAIFVSELEAKRYADLRTGEI